MLIEEDLKAGRLPAVVATSSLELGVDPTNLGQQRLRELFDGVDAIVDAYRNSPQLQAQRAQLRALDETVIQAGAPYRLNAGITATLGYNDRLQRSAIDTGFAEFLLSFRRNPTAEALHATGAGLDGRDDRLLQWISDSGLAVLAADNYAVEALPARALRLLANRVM